MTGVGSLAGLKTFGYGPALPSPGAMANTLTSSGITPVLRLWTGMMRASKPACGSLKASPGTRTLMTSWVTTTT